MGVKQPLVALVLLLSLLAGSGLGLGATQGNGTRGPVYRVAQLASGLHRDPGAWLGHTVLVRGVAGVATCTQPPRRVLCGPLRFMLSDPDPAARWLDLTWTDGGPVLALLRRVPLLRSVVPAPQAIRWGAVAVYRIQLQVERPCGAACYAVVLLDAAPVPADPAGRSGWPWGHGRRSSLVPSTG
jgi:hypothetical protein